MQRTAIEIGTEEWRRKVIGEEEGREKEGNVAAELEGSTGLLLLVGGLEVVEVVEAVPQIHSSPTQSGAPPRSFFSPCSQFAPGFVISGEGCARGKKVISQTNSRETHQLTN